MAKKEFDAVRSSGGLDDVRKKCGSCLQRTKLQAKETWSRVKPVLQTAWNEQVQPRLTKLKLSLIRNVKKSRRSGWLKRRRNRLIVAALLAFSVMLVTWYVVGSILSVFRWLSAGQEQSVFETQLQPQFTSFRDSQMKARIEARVQAATKDKIEEEVERRMHALQISKDFEHYEKERAKSEPKHVKQEKERQEKVREKRSEEIKAFIETLHTSKSFVALHDSENDSKNMGKSSSSSRKKKAKEVPTRDKFGVLDKALEQLGYRRIDGVSDGTFSQAGLMWVVAPSMECESQAFKASINSIADISSIIAFCHGDSQWVGHLGRKDVLIQRLQWFDVKLHRFHDCILYSDFILPSLAVNPTTDLKNLEDQLREADGFNGANRLFIIKHQKPLSELALLGLGTGSSALPLVTTDPIKAIKTIRKKGHDMEGLLVQPYKSNALLWEGRKFTLRSWAFVLHANPLIVLYHDGVILRSLDRYNAFSKQRTKRKVDPNYFANITTHQEDHPDFAQRKRDGYACMDDLQRYLSAVYPNGEMSHFTDLILKPYMKRMMLFAIQALRREHRHDSDVWAMQQICFDFMLDGNWNVWLLDVSPQCPIQVGGPDLSLTCKRQAIDALGTQSIQIAEQLFAAKAKGHLGGSSSWLEGVDIGTFEKLFDGSDPKNNKVEDLVCKRSVYQSFRNRQTFSKRVVQALLPMDGRPRFRTDAELGMDRDEALGSWKCPICGYENSAKATTCDQCGSTEHDVKEHNTGLRGGTSFDKSKNIVEPNELAKEERDSRVGDSFKDELDSFFGAKDPLKAISSSTSSFSSSPPGTPRKQVAVKLDTCAGKQFQIKEAIEIVGHDIEPLRTSTYHACCSSCAINPDCKGFTYIAESYQCWIKSAVGSQGHQDGVVSGVVSGQGQGEGDFHSGRLDGASSSSSSFSSNGPGFQGTNTGSVIHASSASARREYYRQKLISLFEKHDPNKVSKVDSLLDRYRGNEERYILRTMRQYEAIERLVHERQGRGSEGGDGFGGSASGRRGSSFKVQEQKDSHGLSRSDYRDRLEEIFQQNEPSRVSEIDELLERFKGKEMQLVEYLVNKYKA